MAHRAGVGGAGRTPTNLATACLAFLIEIQFEHSNVARLAGAAGSHPGSQPAPSRKGSGDV